MVCYYKEVFGFGVTLSLFIFALVILFEDVIKEWFRRIQNILK